MEFCVATQKVRRLIAAIANSIGPSLWTTRWLPFLRAIVTVPAGNRRIPRDAIPNAERLACPIALQPIAELFNPANRLVPQNNRQADRQFSFPKVNIGTANPCHFCPNQRCAWLQFARQRP